MRYILGLFVLALCSCGNTFYIVRHAEKAPVEAGASKIDASDPPLSDEGRVRAVALREILRRENVQHIFSTSYKRTVSTAKPLSEQLGNTTIQLYSPRKDSMDAFITKLRSIRKGNVLVVGHSNTIDDIANKLSGSTVVPGDLDESEYNNLYEVRRRGKKFVFRGRKY